jgi:hypothetical protein
LLVSTIKDTLKLCLPVEVISSGDLFIEEFFKDISGVSVHSNQTHNLHSGWFVKFTLHHHNQAFQSFFLSIPAFLDCVFITFGV